MNCIKKQKQKTSRYHQKREQTLIFKDASDNQNVTKGLKKVYAFYSN